MSKQIKKKFKLFDFIVARNVIAHVPDPNEIFCGVNNILNDNGIFVIEVPHLENIFKENQYDNIFHEHIGFHSLKSIIDLSSKMILKSLILKKLNLKVVQLDVIFVKKIQQELLAKRLIRF